MSTDLGIPCLYIHLSHLLLDVIVTIGPDTRSIQRNISYFFKKTYVVGTH